MLTTEERRAYIDTLRRLPNQLEALLGPLTPEQLITPYIKGEWTVAQIVHHLVDMHMNSYLRLKLILTAERPAMQLLDQDALAQLPDATDADLQHSLAMLHGLHYRWVQMWESLTDEQWTRIGLIRDTKEITPDYLLEGYARHCNNHLDQIRKTLAAAAPYNIPH